MTFVTWIHLLATAALSELWQVELGREKDLSRGGDGFKGSALCSCSLEAAGQSTGSKHCSAGRHEGVDGEVCGGGSQQEECASASWRRHVGQHGAGQRTERAATVILGTRHP